MFYFVYHEYVRADLGRIFITKLATVPVDELILNLIFCPNIPRQDCPSDHVMAEQVCTLWYCANSLISGPLSSQCYPFFSLTNERSDNFPIPSQNLGMMLLTFR